MKKIIKLINNERTNKILNASKACDTTSTDICSRIDKAECTVNSIDKCVKDYAGCFEHSSDACVFYDTTACGPNGYDVT